MWRAILEPAAFFIAPFIAYVIWLVLRRKYPFAVEHWTHGSLALLSLAGLFLTLAFMLVFGLKVERHQGAYVPAHMENGKLVPGRME